MKLLDVMNKLKEQGHVIMFTALDGVPWIENKTGRTYFCDVDNKKKDEILSRDLDFDEVMKAIELGKEVIYEI